MTILDTIVDHKRTEIALDRSARPEADLRAHIRGLGPTRDFTAALRRSGMRVIAEVKKASPSAGIIRADFDAPAIARAYELNGADAISVLTDRRFFQGSPEYLTAVHRAVGIPVLRKEFIIDPYQLWEARAIGADAVLLIAEILPGSLLADLYGQARALDLHVLVELHDADQVERVVACGAELIGINNRDLRTFTTDLDHTIRVMKAIPSDRVVIAESGIKTPADRRRLAEAGVKGMLVGESLMRRPDVGAALRELMID